MFRSDRPPISGAAAGCGCFATQGGGPARAAAFLSLAAAVLLILPGCTWLQAKVVAPLKAHPASFAAHLAYDRPDPDRPNAALREMTDRAGETFYVGERRELTGSDIETARALRGAESGRVLLQIVLTKIGRERLLAVTRAYYTPLVPVYGAYGQVAVAEPQARLALLINNELICAPPIDAPVTDGQIHIDGIFEFQEAAELAAGLSKSAGP